MNHYFNIYVHIKANIWAISSDTHQLHYIPLYHFTTRYLGRNEILNTKDNEFNSVAISQNVTLCSA